MIITKTYKNYNIYDYIQSNLDELLGDIIFFGNLVVHKEIFNLTDEEFEFYVQTFLEEAFKLGANLNTDEFGITPVEIVKNLINAWKKHIKTGEKESLFTFNYYVELKK